MRALTKQIFLLTLYSWVLLAPGLYRSGTNVVTQTYERAADHFWASENPYAPPLGKGDWFKYSPAFAAVYGAFAALPDTLQALAWALLGACVFWWGISRWFLFSRKSSSIEWIALALVSMELDASLRYQQVNAPMTGLLLVGLADFREKRFGWAGFWLALDTNFKVLPVLFVGLLPWRRVGLVSLLATSIGLLLLPALKLGLVGNFHAHQSWFHALSSDLGSVGLLDIESTVAWWGMPVFGAVLRLTIGVVTLVFLLRLREKPYLGLLTPAGFTLGTACLLLCSPRTESPTFVLMAPAYLFLTVELFKRKKPALWWAALGACAFFITFSFTDLWPKAIWDPREWRYAGKVMGCFIMWAMAGRLMPKGNFRV